jgi:hypothetical protein
VRERSFDWENELAFDPRLRRTTDYSPPYTERVHRPLVMQIYERTATGKETDATP